VKKLKASGARQKESSKQECKRDKLKVVRWMKRDRLKIIAEILQVAKNGAKKTHIMYQCNLSYRQTKKFLTFLLETDFLRIGNSYDTTEKGIRFLQTYQTLELILNTKK
jgi:predicted transcriptional regulator